MILNGLFTIKLVLFWRFWRCNIRPENWCSFFLVIFVVLGVLQHPAQELMFIFPGTFRTFRCSATSGPRTDVHFSCYFSYFSVFCNIRPKNWCPHHTCSFFVVIFVVLGVLQHPAQELMFIFPGTFRTFRCSATSGPRTDGDFSWYLSYFSVFCNIRPENWCSFFLVIFVLLDVLQHPAQELMFIFPGTFRTFRCSATSGPRTDGDFSWYLSYFSVFCNIRPKNWCPHHTCSFFVVLFVLFGVLQDCGGVFGVFVVLFLVSAPL